MPEQRHEYKHRRIDLATIEIRLAYIDRLQWCCVVLQLQSLSEELQGGAERHAWPQAGRERAVTHPHSTMPAGLHHEWAGHAAVIQLDTLVDDVLVALWHGGVRGQRG